MRLDKPIGTTPDDELHEKIWYCPRSASIAVNEWFEDYVRYCKGFLPRSGGFYDQDNVTAEVLQLLHGETDRETAEMIAKLEKDRQKAELRNRQKR